MNKAKVRKRVEDTTAAMRRAAERMRKQIHEQEQEKYQQSRTRFLAQWRESRQQLESEHGRTCPWCETWLPPRFIDGWNGPQLVRRDRCGCPEEAEALALEAERRRQARLAFEVREWARTLERAGLMGWLADATFDTFYVGVDDEGAMACKGTAERYRDALLADKLEFKPWLVLWGPYGTGKSHLAAAIVHDALANGWKRCYFRVWTEYLRRLKNSFDRKENEERTSDIVAELQAGRLVVIDDIDKQHPSRTGWAEEELFTALNYRYNDLLPTILTFNRQPTAMTPWLGAALIDRVLGRAFDVVQFGGPSYRSEIDWDAALVEEGA